MPYNKSCSNCAIRSNLFEMPATSCDQTVENQETRRYNSSIRSGCTQRPNHKKPSRTKIPKKIQPLVHETHPKTTTFARCFTPSLLAQKETPMGPVFAETVRNAFDAFDRAGRPRPQLQALQLRVALAASGAALVGAQAGAAWRRSTTGGVVGGVWRWLWDGREVS